MRNGYRVLDTDSHMMEPPSIWRDYIDPNFADRAPQIGDMGNGRPGMMVEGEPITRQDGNYPMHSTEFLEAAARGMEKHEAARAAGFDPKSRLHDMDEHGVDAQVIYPTVGGSDARQAVPRYRASGRGLSRLQRLEPRVLQPRPRAAAHGGDAAGAGAGPRRRGSASGGPTQGLRASTSVPTPSRTATCTTRATRRCGAPWRNWACRCASTIRARPTCRRSATGWRPTPRDTSSPTRSRRWWP